MPVGYTILFTFEYAWQFSNITLKIERREICVKTRLFFFSVSIIYPSLISLTHFETKIAYAVGLHYQLQYYRDILFPFSITLISPKMIILHIFEIKLLRDIREV